MRCCVAAYYGSTHRARLFQRRHAYCCSANPCGAAYSASTLRVRLIAKERRVAPRTLLRFRPTAPGCMELPRVRAPSIAATISTGCHLLSQMKVATNGLYVLLSSQVPEGLGVTTQMTIRLGDRQRPEPDVLVIDRAALEDNERTWYRLDETHLVIEIVSPNPRHEI